jgi:transposase
MRTVDIEQLVEAGHPVRGIWEMMGQLELSEMEQDIRAREGVAGQNTLSPRLLGSLWIYGLSEGVNSARELSRMCETDAGCQWLTAMDPINYHTLSDFRANHGVALEKIFVQVAGLMSAEGLIEMKRVAQDGTKIRASAGGDTFRREERIKVHLELARKQIEDLKPAGEEVSERVAKARARAQDEKQQRLERALRELKAIRETTNKTAAEARVSTTDPEARIMKQADGGYAPS